MARGRRPQQRGGSRRGEDGQTLTTGRMRRRLGIEASLRALYEATGGAAWLRRDNWLTGNACRGGEGYNISGFYESYDNVYASYSYDAGEQDGWYGVVCNETDGGSVRLHLQNNQLSGRLPTQIGTGGLDFTHLHLSANRISGTLPSELWRQSALSVLDVNNNHVSGTLPSEVGRLSKLSILQVKQNLISGTLPSAVGHLSVLSSLLTSQNALSGTIPSEVGELSMLLSLQLHSSHISGSLPSEVGRLRLLSYLGVYSNALSGTLPSELEQLSKLLMLQVNQNPISGTLPSEVGRLSVLSMLLTSHSALSGTIPSEVGELSVLLSLYTETSALSGSLPSELARLSDLSQLVVSTNSFTGALPTQLARLAPSLQVLDLRSNSLALPRTLADRHALTLATYACIAGTVTSCLGLPPYSCSAFASHTTLRPSLTNPGECTRCHWTPPWLGPLALIIALTLAAAVALIGFLVLIQRHPGGLRRWVSTCSILAVHCQTLSLFGTLGLGWPPAVQALLDALALHGLNLPMLSCFLGGPDGEYPDGEYRGEYRIAPSTVYATTLAGLALGLLGLPAALLMALDHHPRLREQHAAMAANLECMLTLVDALFFTFTFRTAADAFLTEGQQTQVNHDQLVIPPPPAIVHIATGLASAAVALQFFLAIRFAASVKAYQAGCSTGVWTMPRVSGCLARNAAAQPILPRQAATRVAFLTRRFSPRQPFWQFVIWLRQGLLFTIALTLKLLLRSLDGLTSQTPVRAARYSLASAAMATVAIAWVAHVRSRPYAYTAQNALESWLFLADLLLLGMAIANAIVSEEGNAAPAWVQVLLEVLLFALIIGSLLYAARRLWLDVRATRHLLRNLELSDVLLKADAKIDEPVRACLADGSIRLLRCSWLLSDEADAVLDKSSDGKPRMHRRQELPEDAFFAPEEAVRLLDRKDRSVLVLTYRWLTALHPDPFGSTLTAVRRYLASDRTLSACGLFWDFPSVPQKDVEYKRTDEELKTFKRALPEMNKLYASITGTAVIQLKDIPPRPSEYDGRVTIYNPPKASHISSSSDGDDGDDAAVRADLGRFGEVAELLITPMQGHKGGYGSDGDSVVIAHFTSHAQAEACIATLREERRDVATVYNETNYSRDRGQPYSGWCTMEQGSSMLVAAHLANAEQQAVQCKHERKLQLPQHFVQAQRSRPKVTDISGGQVQPRLLSGDPDELLQLMSRDLRGAHFVGKGDKRMVQQMLAEFEWIMKSAVEEALALRSPTPCPDLLSSSGDSCPTSACAYTQAFANHPHSGCTVDPTAAARRTAGRARLRGTFARLKGALSLRIAVRRDRWMQDEQALRMKPSDWDSVEDETELGLPPLVGSSSSSSVPQE